MRTIKYIVTLFCIAFICSVSASSPYSLERAKELYNDGRWIDSRLELLNVKSQIECDNIAKNEEVDFFLSLCAVALDDVNAESYLISFEEQYPSSLYSNQVKFARAMLYCSDERYEVAKDMFSQVNPLALNTREREKYNVRMGYILFCEGDYSGARACFVDINKRSEVYHHALYYLSYMDYAQGDNTLARKGFQELLHNDAYKSVAPYYLLQIDFNDGNYRNVIKEGERLYNSSTALRKRELSRAMAEAAFRLEEYDNCIKYLDKFTLDGGAIGREESYLKGFSLYRNVRYRDAITYLRGACGADDELTQNASYHLADCYLKIGDKSSALNSFAMASNDSFSAQIAEESLFNYAKLQYELGDDHFNRTINVLSRYLRKYPDAERCQQIKALLVAAYYNSENYDAAYASIKEIKNPDADVRLALQRVSLHRGLDSYNRGDYDMAQASLRESQAINISPKYSSTSRYWQGEIEYIQGDYEAALKSYNSYLANAPKNDENYAMALFNIGYAKLMLGKADEALGYLHRFISYAESDESDRGLYLADAYNRVGDIFYSKRQYAQATKSYSSAAAKDNDMRYYADYQNAIIDGVTGRYTNKIDGLTSIVNSGKGAYVEDAMYELGRSYIASGNYKSGVKWYERFVEDYPTSDKYAQALSDLGLANLNLGDKSASLSYYDRAIKAAPQSALAKDALQGIREIYVDRGDIDAYFDYASTVGVKTDKGSIERDSLSFASAQKLYLSNHKGSSVSIDALKDYISEFPKGYYTVDALYYLSDSYLKAKRNRDAINSLTTLANHGANQYSERVYDKLSSACYSEGQYSRSADAYKKLFEIGKSSTTKSRALEGYADATIKMNESQATLKMADFVLTQALVSPELIVKVKHAKAKMLNKNGDKKSAFTIFKELSADPTSVQGAESAYIIINESFASGDFEVAEKQILDFSASNTSQLFWLAKSFIVLGDIYCQRNDYFQARATYQSVIDGYGVADDGVVDMAKSKINNLPKE